MKEIFTIKETLGCIHKPSDLFDKLQTININYKQENFILFVLDTKNKVIHSEIVFKGGLNECTIYPNIIFNIAVKYNANSIIVAHNHPTGNLQPSSEDKEVMDRLKQCGKLINITLLDSIIFNKHEWYNMNI